MQGHEQAVHGAHPRGGAVAVDTLVDDHQVELVADVRAGVCQPLSQISHAANGRLVLDRLQHAADFIEVVLVRPVSDGHQSHEF